LWLGSARSQWFFFSDSRKYLNKNPFLRCIHIVFKYQKQQIRHISS
jgi:hypothetical protein